MKYHKFIFPDPLHERKRKFERHPQTFKWFIVNSIFLLSIILTFIAYKVIPQIYYEVFLGVLMIVGFIVFLTILAIIDLYNDDD